MAKHVEREQTNPATELTADEMERMPGFITIALEGRKDQLVVHERQRLLVRAGEVIEQVRPVPGLAPLRHAAAR